MTREEKLERIKSRQWYHSIEIEQGLVTPGAHPLAELRQVLEYLKLPARLDGLSVLDIGAWDGFFSFEAERRGARRVVAYDVTPADYFGFATARELLGSKVEYVQGSVYELSEGGRRDLRRRAVRRRAVPPALPAPGARSHPRRLRWLHGAREPLSGQLRASSKTGEVTTLERIDPRLERHPAVSLLSGQRAQRRLQQLVLPESARDRGRASGPRAFSPPFSRSGAIGSPTRRRQAGVPEYLQETYEGMFVRGADGVVRNTFPRARPDGPRSDTE